jgi:hypothetical protein
MKKVLSKIVRKVPYNCLDKTLQWHKQMLGESTKLTPAKYGFNNCTIELIKTTDNWQDNKSYIQPTFLVSLPYSQYEKVVRSVQNQSYVFTDTIKLFDPLGAKWFISLSSKEVGEIEALVIKSPDIEKTKKNIENILDISFDAEKHGSGPNHFAVNLLNLVLEIYPATPQSTQVEQCLQHKKCNFINLLFNHEQNELPAQQIAIYESEWTQVELIGTNDAFTVG